MAQIDVSFLMEDQDFVDPIQIIKRQASVNNFGESVLVETVVNGIASVQGLDFETLKRYADSARLDDLITVYYKGKLNALIPNGYADIVVWNGARYHVKNVTENFYNFGAGFTVAVCELEQAYV